MKLKTNWNLARRDLLKALGLGAACLPLLQRPARAAVARPLRLMVIELTMGYRQKQWRPSTGPLGGQALPSTCEPFEPHKSDMVFLPDLTNPNSRAGSTGAFGVMFYGLGSTGGGQYKEPTGPTLDQVVAAGLPASPRRSVCLGVQVDRPPQATSSPGGRRCFWAGAGQPIDPLGDPTAAYEALFAGGDYSGQEQAGRRLMIRRKSILDHVGQTLQGFGRRLGTEDRLAIDAHFEAIRDLERMLGAQAEVARCGTTRPAPIDLDAGESYPLILKAHLRLMVHALKCGVTSVATLQTSDASGQSVNFGFVPGVPATSKNNYKTPFRNWHDLGNSPVQDGVDHKAIVEKWFMQQFAETFAEMKAIPEGDGATLFDNTIVLIGNYMGDGGLKDTQKAPWMLAGKGGGALATGNCLASEGKPISSVMAGICTALGVKHPYGEVLPGLLRP